MPIKDAKIYNDGSHFIAIPPENFTSGKHKKQPPKATTQGTAEQAQAYTEQNIERKKTNAAKRYMRLWRKVRLQQWNYFITFTFDGNKHTEESFRKSLSNTLKHLVSRKEWKYIGVWERGKATEDIRYTRKRYDRNARTSNRL